MNFILGIFLLLASGHTVSSIKVVATTSLIGTILKQIGDDKVDVITIVRAGMCPGHFDVKPSDVVGLTTANAILCHGFEGWLSKLINSVNNENIAVETLKIEGNWMIPDIQKVAAARITEILVELDPQHTEFYRTNLTQYEKLIDSVAAEIKNVSVTFHHVKAICANYQATFLKWLGFDVIATYGRPEELSPKELCKLIELARKHDVRIVVDNLQSGGHIGRVIADELGVSHVVLTNFPLGDSYIQSLMDNVERLVNGLRD